jgi:CO dehydrogenase maturation factor
MRIALAGKGGAGKTTISATLARLHARNGAQVVAIDADSNPNLGTALGIDQDLLATASFLPVSLISRRLDRDRALAAAVDEVVRTHGLEGPDGVRMVGMGAPGHADAGCLCSAHATVSALLSDLEGTPDTVAIVDMEASPEHVSRGTARHADVLLLVTEPYFRSLEAARRIAELATELPIETVAVVVNKVRSAAESEAVAEFCERHGLTRLGEVPWSDDITRADLAARPLLDTAPDGPAVAAIAELSARLHGTVPVH